MVSVERRMQQLLLIGMVCDFIGAVFVLSAVLDFSSVRFHNQLSKEVAYIDSELIKARQKAVVGLVLISIGFALPVIKEIYTLRTL